MKEKKTSIIKSLIASVALLATMQNSYGAGESAVDNGDGSVTLSGTGVTNLDLTTYDATYSKIIIDGLTGYLKNSNQTIAADIEIATGGLTLSDGYSNYTYTFSGNLIGVGNFEVTKNPTLLFKFNGDNSAFTGNFDNTSGGTNTTFQFGDGTTAAPAGSVTGSGYIATQTNVIFNYTGDAVSSSDISGSGAMVWQGIGELRLTGAVTNTGTNSTLNGGTIVFGPAPAVYFVDPAGDNSDGSTWAKAYTTIDAAITAATAPAEIWVKGGTDYVLAASLTMKSDVAVYGGFAGTEASKDDRATSDRNSNGKIEAWEFASETVIDGAATYRVVDFTGSDSATISGFTIKNGASTSSGAGVLTADNATVEACVISGNTVTLATTSNEGPGGGGIALTGTWVSIDGCFIYGNFTNGEGGALNVIGSGVVQRCIIVNNETNSSHYTGAVLLNPAGAFTFAHNVVAMNQGGASDSAGLRVASAANTTLVNSIVWGNKRTNGNFNQTENIGTIHNLAIQGEDFSAVNLNGTNDDAAGPNFGTVTSFWGRPSDEADPAAAETEVLATDWSINDVSPCINAGADSVSGITLPTEDITGTAIPQHTVADIGAYEYDGLVKPFADDQAVTYTFGSTGTITITLNGSLHDTFNSPDLTGLNGTVVENANYATNGIVTYEPNGFTGTDTFTFTTQNSVGTSTAATVTITVEAIYYVDYDKTNDDGDGTSWTEAKSTIGAAASLDAAKHIYVKSGNFTIANKIVIPSGIEVYGGFDGTEMSLSERSKPADAYAWEFSTPTVFDGAGAIADRIVTVNGGVLDGFTIKNSPNGGAEFGAANSTIRNCIVRDNQRTTTAYTGQSSGISFGQGNNNLTVEGCWVHNNEILGGSHESGAGIGTGVTVTTSGLLVSGCWVTNNKAPLNTHSGGIGSGRHATMSIINTLVAHNEGASGANSASGIGHHNTISATVTVTNCTIVNNKGDAAAVRKVALNNSVVWGNVNNNDTDNTLDQIQDLVSADSNAVQDDNLHATNDDVNGPNFFVPSAIVGNQNGANYSTGDWYLKGHSPLVNAGNLTLQVGTKDVAGNDRLNETSALDIGAYTYDTNHTPVVGIEVVQNGTELTWTVADEIGVKEYQVVDVATGEVIAVVDATGLETYAVTLSEGVDAKLIVVDNSGFTQSFYPENGDIRTVAYSLNEGWNLITVTTENADLTQLKKVTTGDFWIWNGDAYEVTTSPQPTQGVWVYANNATEVTVSGIKSDAEMTVNTGWNLVGPVENSNVPAEATLIYNWNEVYETIAIDQGVLLQGVGYWIFSF